MLFIAGEGLGGLLPWKVIPQKWGELRIKNIDAIAMSEDEHLYGAILELLDSLTNLSDNNAEVLLLSSAENEDKLDQEIRSYFKGVI